MFLILTFSVFAGLAILCNLALMVSWTPAALAFYTRNCQGICCGQTLPSVPTNGEILLINLLYENSLHGTCTTFIIRPKKKILIVIKQFRLYLTWSKLRGFATFWIIIIFLTLWIYKFFDTTHKKAAFIKEPKRLKVN